MTNLEQERQPLVMPGMLVGFPNGSLESRQGIARATVAAENQNVEQVEINSQRIGVSDAAKGFFLGEKGLILWWEENAGEHLHGVRTLRPFSDSEFLAKPGDEFATPILVLPLEISPSDLLTLARLQTAMEEVANRAVETSELAADFEDIRVFGAFGATRYAEPIGEIKSKQSGEISGLVFPTIWSCLRDGGVYLICWIDSSQRNVGNELWVLDKKRQQKFLADLGLN